MIIKIIIVCIITAITYLAFPIIMLWINHGQFIKKRARLIALLNSIVVGIIYLILTTIIYGNGVWNAAPACIFYFINCAILTDKTKTTKNKTNLHRLTLLGIFTAIILLMSFTPLGYLRLGAIEITLIIIPVALGAILTDSKGGLYLGTIFGLTSFIVGLSSPMVLLLIDLDPVINTILIFIWLVVPRALMGFLVSIIFKAVSKIDKTKTISFLIAAASGAILNTLLYITFMLLTFGFNKSFLELFGADSIIVVIISLITVNALIEVATSLIVGGGLSKALSVYLPGVKKLRQVTDQKHINSETTDTAVDQGDIK